MISREEHLTEFLAYDNDGVEYSVVVYRITEQHAVRFRLETLIGDYLWPICSVDGEPGAFDILIGEKKLRIRSSSPAAFECWDKVTPR